MYNIGRKYNDGDREWKAVLNKVVKSLSKLPECLVYEDHAGNYNRQNLSNRVGTIHIDIISMYYKA